jgi:hypothetical protein
MLNSKATVERRSIVRIIGKIPESELSLSSKVKGLFEEKATHL